MRANALLPRKTLSVSLGQMTMDFPAPEICRPSIEHHSQNHICDHHLATVKMRAKRSKQYRKLMQQYALNFGLREPYQILLSASIIATASRAKLPLGALLQGTIHGQIKPMITQCCIRHLYDLETTNDQEKREKDALIDVAKKAERRRCGHHELEEPLTELKCLESVVGGRNKFGYVIATQDQEVRARMREIPGVPLIYINRSVMILEPMSPATAKARDTDERGKIRAGLKGRRPTGAAAKTGEKRKREEESDEVDGEMPDRARMIMAAEAEASEQGKKRKIKGPKGPNPLSVKKVKKDGGKKSGGREIEDDGAAVRKAMKKNPQAAEKAGTFEGEEDVCIEREARKRKRKRNVKANNEASGENQAGIVAAD